MPLKNSKDAIEQLYESEVLRDFPNYEIFWERFIGNPDSETAEPYEYNYPKAVTGDERKKIDESYLKIQMSHYTLFCHIAGVFFQIKELQKALELSDCNEKYFRCCEHFETGYMHIGSIFYVMETFWCTILKTLGHKEGKKGLGKVITFLKGKKRGDLVQKLCEVNENIMDRRHLPVHFSRVFIKWHHGLLYVPKKVNEIMLWPEGKSTTEWKQGDKQLANDLLRVQRLLNDLHEVLIEEYAAFIERKGIVIKKEGAT